MGWTDSLKVIIDTEQSAQHIGRQPNVWDNIEVSSTHAKAVYQYVWYEPNICAFTIRPKQLREDFYLDDSVVRHPKEMWVLTDAHWDDVEREHDRYIVSDGTNEEIVTKTVFPENCGFALDTFLWGMSSDQFWALRLTFGSWTLDIYASGHTEIYYKSDFVGKGYLSFPGKRSIVDDRGTILITPTLGRQLLVSRNACGFLVKMPDEDEEIPVIDEAPFCVRPSRGGKVLLGLTQLDYRLPEGKSAWWLSPTRALPTPPVTGQEVQVRPNWFNIGGGVTAQLYKPLPAGGDFDDLEPFIPNGEDSEYALGFILTPNGPGTIAPWVSGGVVTIKPSEEEREAAQGDVTDDVIKCSIAVGEDALATSAEIVVRHPEHWDLEGECNRRAIIAVGDQVVLDGLFADPPERIEQEGDAPRLRLTVSGLAGKMAEQPCLSCYPVFDGQKHTDVVHWLLRYCGVPEEMLEIQESEWPLPITFKSQDRSDSQLAPQIADSPREWIRRICEITGWDLIDGPLEGTGNYGYRYLDPLDLSWTSEHTFHVLTEKSSGPHHYDLLRSELLWKSIEPEANEVHVIAGAEDGSLVNCVYIDEASQEPELPPGERPDNWLGFRKIVTVVFDAVLPEDVLKRVTLRFGHELVRRCDMVEFEADWRPGLWRGSCITLDMDDTGLPWEGLYRIVTLDIECVSEFTDPPLRRAHYKAVRLTRTTAEQARPIGDQRLAQALSYWLRFGPKRDMTRVKPEFVEGQGGPVSTMWFAQPPSRVIRVTAEEGLEEFVLGANGLDDSVIVK